MASLGHPDISLVSLPTLANKLLVSVGLGSDRDSNPRAFPNDRELTEELYRIESRADKRWRKE